MKKTLLTISLAVLLSAVFSSVSNAATVTYTKPTVKVNTTQEESVISKKMKEIEQKQADAKAKQDAVKKDVEKAKADAKAKQDAVKKDVEKAKVDAKVKQDAVKKDVEKAKVDAKAKQDENKAAAKARQKQRTEAIDNFKNSFKY